MEWLYAHIGAVDSALQQAPEVFQPIGMDAAIHVLHGVIDNLMRVIALQSFVGKQCVGVQGRTSFDLFSHFRLQFFLFRLVITLVRIFPPRSRIPMTAVLSLPPVPVILRLRSLMCILRALPPMKVSSASTSEPGPPILTKDLDCTARRMRCIMNHADFWV